MCSMRSFACRSRRAAMVTAMQPLRDLDQVRSFLSGGGPTALFDLPWMPIYLGICFLFHFWIGVTALVGALVLVGITILTETRTRGPAKAVSRLGVTRSALAAEGRRNAEVLHAMGMRRQAALRWRDVNGKYLAAHEQASDVASGLGGLSKFFRSFLQSLVLAVGAVLVINQESTAGIIIAGSILSARALAPVEMAIANWKGFIGARQSAHRLDQLLKLLPDEVERLATARARQRRSWWSSSMSRAPDSEKVILQDISFQLKGGEAVGIIGPADQASRRWRVRWSASGRGCVARSSSTTRRSNSGRLMRWASTSAICRRTSSCSTAASPSISRGSISHATSQAVLEAAHAAGAHDLILSLPRRLCHAGSARAEWPCPPASGNASGSPGRFYGNPFLVVLDEPTSNVDSEGEEALTAAITSVRSRGGIVAVIAHRPKALEGVDHVLVIGEGRVQSFGPKEEVLKKVLRPAAPLRVVADGQGGGRWIAK